MRDGAGLTQDAPPVKQRAADELDERELRIHFRAYFAGEAQRRGLLRFENSIKQATLWLGAALWLLTIPISLYEGWRILQVGLGQAATIEIIAVTIGLFVGGGILLALGTGQVLWTELLHNFWRYFLLLLTGPALLLVAWYFHTQDMDLWRNGSAILAALLILLSFRIGSRPPPNREQIEAQLDRAFDAHVKRHLDHLLLH